MGTGLVTIIDPGNHMSFFVNSFLYPLLVWGQTEPSGARQRLGYGAASASEGAASQPCLALTLATQQGSCVLWQAAGQPQIQGVGKWQSWWPSTSLALSGYIWIYFNLAQHGPPWQDRGHGLERHNMRNNLAGSGCCGQDWELTRVETTNDHQADVQSPRWIWWSFKL